MSDIRYVTGVTPQAVDGDDKFLAVQGTRDGAIYTMDWGMAKALEGRVYVANAGSVTSELTFGAGDIDTTEPDLFLSVPLGTTVVPLEIRVKMQAYGTTLIFELMAATGTGGVAGTDTNLTYGTLWGNLRSDGPNSSLCTVGHSSAADATYMTTNVVEFWREGIMLAATTATGDDDSSKLGETWVWNAKQAGWAPVLVGASQLMVFASSQAGKGFITIVYAEFPSTRIS